jgi:hypothetical protein
MMQKMADIGKLIREQDNRITDCPIFVVQEKVRDAGYDSGYASSYEWIDYDRDHKVAGETRAARLDALDDDGRKFGAWERVYYIDRWEFVTACFTEQGCKDFISRDGHNHGECRIYAYGSYRNQEYRDVREFLKEAHP